MSAPVVTLEPGTVVKVGDKVIGTIGKNGKLRDTDALPEDVADWETFQLVESVRWATGRLAERLKPEVRERHRVDIWKNLDELSRRFPAPEDEPETDD